ncbi:folate-binding protein YgfZ [Aquabacterium sp.]|uniref:CAF17-like 4Fe-4S cluster assembly/insertion protein YgfZ n=1 Tax=Aquabacterium sp. TaxID=1872578 RepID=UPI0035AECF85
MNTSAIQLDGAVRLQHWGVIRAQGDDAATFLHGQLSQDIKTLAAHQARLGALCTAKGRMLASFVAICPQPNQYWLACSADLLPATLKRLSMFVLRAKVKLDDASSDVALIGLTGPSAQARLGDLDLAVWSSVAQADGVLTRLPDGSANGAHVRRYLWAGPAAQADTLLAGNPALPLDSWKWLDVTSGVASIVAGTVEQFVPQMVNFELVGGVNFKKGCYPGQEIVARSQYLGKLKRRAVLTQTDAAAQPGQEIFSAEDSGQPCGMVVNIAPHPTRGFSALVETKLAALEGAGLHLGSPDGPVMHVVDLPYSLPDETTESAQG